MDINYKMWDTERKQMFTSALSVERGLRAKLRVPGQAHWSGLNMLENSEKYVALMFTGMLDRNKKEIWEGDIVYYYVCSNEAEFDDDGNIIKETKIMGKHKAVVYYEPEAGCFSMRAFDEKLKEISEYAHGNDNDTMPCFALADYIEVIGCIYEEELTN